MAGISRIKKELRDIRRNPPAQCSAGPVGDDFYKWEAMIVGPPDTPYEKGIFYLDITLPPSYPFQAPTIRFRTPIYHMNVRDGGGICMDTLTSKWTPALTMSKVLLTVSVLLCDPNPHNPWQGELAQWFLKDRPKYDEEVRQHTRKHAMPN